MSLNVIIRSLLGAHKRSDLGAKLTEFSPIAAPVETYVCHAEIISANVQEDYPISCDEFHTNGVRFSLGGGSPSCTFPDSIDDDNATLVVTDEVGSGSPVWPAAGTYTGVSISLTCTFSGVWSGGASGGDLRFVPPIDRTDDGPRFLGRVTYSGITFDFNFIYNLANPVPCGINGELGVPFLDSCDQTQEIERYCSCYEIQLLTLLSPLNFKNQPIILDDANGNSLLSIPALPCDPSEFHGGRSTVSPLLGVMYALFDPQTGFSSEGTAITIYSKENLEFPAIGSLIGFTIPVATWNIISFDAVEDRIEVGAHYIHRPAKIVVEGSLSNDGEFTVIDSPNGIEVRTFGPSGITLNTDSYILVLTGTTFGRYDGTYTCSINVDNTIFWNFRGGDLLDKAYNGDSGGSWSSPFGHSGTIRSIALDPDVSYVRYIYVQESINQEAAQGTVKLAVGQWVKCVDYTAVTQTATDLYDAVAFRDSGDTFFGNTLIKITDTALYNGTHAIQIITGSKAKLVGTAWIGDDLAGGNWVNNEIELTTEGHSAFNFRDGRITDSSVADYNGDFSVQYWGSTTLRIDGLFFNGTATGTVNWEGFDIDATGTVETYSDASFSLVISGTSNYNGTYTCNAVGSGGSWAFDGGDLDVAFFAGTETGSWQESGNPGRSGSITAFNATLTPIAFTSVIAEDSGVLDKIVNSAVRVFAIGHDTEQFDYVSLLSESDPTVYSTESRDILLSISSYVDVEGEYDSDDLGKMRLARNLED